MYIFRTVLLTSILLISTTVAYSEDKCQSTILEQYPEPNDTDEYKFSKRRYWIRTDKLTEDGKSKERDCTFVESFNKPGDNRVWVEAKVTNIIDPNNPPRRNEKPKCWVDFSDYVETLPGITEPKTAIFHASAKHGGSFKVGEYGETWCLSEAYYTRVP